MDSARYSGEECLEAVDDDGDTTISHSETSSVIGGGSSDSEGWSLTSSIFDYLYVNGRRYLNCRDGYTLLPNDEIEQDRLDMYHQLQRMILDGELHLAPIESEGFKVKRILDLGTGTGIWAIDMADKYPDTEILGVDLSPIQPGWVPPNLKFEIDNIENEWTFTRNFDFIHIRGLAGSILDWPYLLQQAYRYLKPGGYIEVHENDFILDTDDEPQSERLPFEGTYLQKYIKLLNEAAQLAGRELPIVLRMKELLEEAKFVDVKRVTRKLPWGTWPRDPKLREVGAWVMIVLESGLEAYAMQLLTRTVHMSPKDVTDLVEGCKKEMKERKLHLYTREHILYARKPLSASISHRRDHHPRRNPQDIMESILNSHSNAESSSEREQDQDPGETGSMFSERSRNV